MPIYEIILIGRVEISGRYEGPTLASCVDSAKQEMLRQGELSDVQIERCLELNADEDPDFFQSVSPV